MNRAREGSALDRWLGAAGDGGRPGPCPDPNVLAGLAEGALPPEARDALTPHVAACAACREVVAAIAAAGVGSEPAGRPAAIPRRMWLWAAAAAVLALLGGRLLGPGAPEGAVTLETLMAEWTRGLGPGGAPLAPLSEAELAAPSPVLHAPVLRGGFQVLRPGGVSLDDRPAVAWAAGAGSGPLVVTLLDEDGVRWSLPASGSPFAYPPGEPPLPRGRRYVVEVAAGEPATATASRSFAVAEESAVGAWSALLARAQVARAQVARAQVARAQVARAQGGAGDPLAWLAVAHAALRLGYAEEAESFARRYAEARPDDPRGPAILAHLGPR